MEILSSEKTQKTYTPCAVITEYNPFHNGHLHQLGQIRALPGIDGVLCLMSGNFTQRGECAILDKYTRARHAVTGGADLVAELPLPFAVGNAETFADGAIAILSALPVHHLAFGCECGTAEEFYALAAELNDESPAFRTALKEELAKGESFVRSRNSALKRLHPELDERLFSSPNCVLGLEYTRAILRRKADIEIHPLQRIGSGHGCAELQKNYSSASAIRRAILSAEDTLDNLPDFVRADLSLCLSPDGYSKADAMEYFALIERTREQLSVLPDCTEGLDFALKKALSGCFSAKDVITVLTGRRYTAARIRRILLAALFDLTKEKTERLKSAPLYLKPLAVNARNSDMVLSFLQKGSKIPLLTSKKEEENLSPEGKELLSLTGQADTVYSALCGRKHLTYGTQFV